MTLHYTVYSPPRGHRGKLLLPDDTLLNEKYHEISRGYQENLNLGCHAESPIQYHKSGKEMMVSMFWVENINR